MLRYWKAIREERQRMKVEKLETMMKKKLIQDVFDEKLLRRIAVEYGYHFEIQRPDGLIIRFEKEGKEIESKGGSIF
jgi:hypothetical protein